MSAAGSGGAKSGAISSFDEIDKKTGEFKREETTLRHRVGSEEFPVEEGRYHLYISLACPWACRCYAYLKLKGLDDAITMSVVAPVWGATAPDVDDHHGWMFDQTGEVPEATVDHVYGAKSMREVYERLAPSVKRPTTPLLIDKKANKAVNNESADITRMFNDDFNAIAKNPGVNLFPAALEDSIKEMNEWIYDINNGVYRCGFAFSQDAYEEAFDKLFASLDRCEDILSSSRYLHGSDLTDTDIRLFVTLIRFDDVYAVHFKTNKRLIREYPNLKGYTQDLYQTPGIHETVSQYHIMQHYYRSHPKINPTRVVAKGNKSPWISEPHDRATKFA